ncbi:hypothetical protein MCOR02_007283 [Pyricularia oryzae]|nr:hypothetical protein MCOR02_007283 [Pyricularia oryzae]KAI6319423.1 hypothetical protein MCOR34_003289 [Pyricularia oryzae]KAI6458658.1 hypothetical protein MCOR17_007307 [Pyricularia oryzae]KAI6512379.1 hypothetical protein MCOR13_000178 [Pyricularia oryzae]KAI6549332.1 hypothetical protein MCOR04_011426 [Pyricularia oryzae]
MSTQPSHRLYILDTDLSTNVSTRHGRIISCRPDGSDLRTVVDGIKNLPDGIVVDHDRGLMYWTSMGTSLSAEGGSIERAKLDGSDHKTIIASGTVGVFTPKQITLARRSGKLYWCDREGMKVMRANADGSGVEVLWSTGNAAEEDDRRDQMRWCVGVAVDEERGFVYWTQKGPSKGGKGRIFRGPLSQSPFSPDDVEVLIDGLPEPIDLEVDEQSGTLYWTDRGDPPTGNSLNCVSIADVEGVMNGTARGQVRTLARRLHETIGLALDKSGGVCYVTDLAGGVYAVDIKSGQKTVIFSELGDTTGIALV